MDQMTLSNPRLPQHYVPIVDDRDFIDSRKLGLILWTHKWRIAALAAAATLAVILILQNITPVYRATASLVIEPKGATLITFQQPTYDSPNAAVDYLQTQITLIQSRAVAERVVRQLNLTEHPSSIHASVCICCATRARQWPDFTQAPFPPAGLPVAA